MTRRGPSELRRACRRPSLLSIALPFQKPVRDSSRSIVVAVGASVRGNVSGAPVYACGELGHGNDSAVRTRPWQPTSRAANLDAGDHAEPHASAAAARRSTHGFTRRRIVPTAADRSRSAGRRPRGLDSTRKEATRTPAASCGSCDAASPNREFLPTCRAGRTKNRNQSPPSSHYRCVSDDSGGETSLWRRDGITA